MNTSFYLAFPLTLLLLVLQVSISSHMGLFGVTPQLLFLVTVPWGLYYGLQQGFILAFVSGILIDLFSAGPMGGSSLALMAAVTAAVIFKRFLPENRIIVPAILGAIASLVFWMVYILLVRILVPVMINSLDFLSVARLADSARARLLMNDITGGYGLGGVTGSLVLRSTLVHSVLIVPVYWALSTVDRLFKPRGVEI